MWQLVLRAFILAVAMLHVVNAAVLQYLSPNPTQHRWVQDAMVQWWYGHNAVDFS